MLITDEHIETYAMIDHGNGLTTLYTDFLYRMTQGQLIANAGEIEANRFCYNALLTMRLDREQLKVLAAMDNPLEAVRGAWASAQEVEQEEEFSHTLFEICGQTAQEQTMRMKYLIRERAACRSRIFSQKEEHQRTGATGGAAQMPLRI